MKKLLLALLMISNLAVAQIQTINVGSTPNDGTGDALRVAMQKVNANFTFVMAQVALKATSPVALATDVSGVLPVANGGTGTATPALVAGTNVTITGTWPNQTVNSTGGGGGGGEPSDGDKGDITVNGGAWTVDNNTITGAKLSTLSSSDLATKLTDESGTDKVAFTNSPTFTTPALGTPSAIVLTNGTALPGTSVINTPAGNISSPNSQAAINELDTEKAPLASVAKIYSVESYGGRNDLQSNFTASVTSGTNSLTCTTCSFTSDVTGKSARVYGAGAAGVDLLTTITFVNSTTVTLGTNASTTISNKQIEWGTDNVPFVQAAADACNSGGGGDVYFRDGIYGLFGPLIGSPNSQIQIPFTNSASTKTTIRFIGESSVQWANGPFAAQTNQTKGVVLKSQISGSGTLPAVFKSLNNSYTTPIFQNIQIITKSIDGTTHIAPTMSALILEQCESKQLYDVVLVTESDPTESVEPVAETYGAWLSTQGKTDHQSVYSNVSASCYFYGFRIGEHVVGDLTPICNIYGVRINAGTSAHSIGVSDGIINNLWNRYGVGFTGGGATVKLNILTEKWPGIFASKWYDYSADIFFPTSQDVNGEITISVTAAGGAASVPVVSGTNTGNLSILDLKNMPAIFTDDNSYALIGQGSLPSEVGYVVRSLSANGYGGYTFSNNNAANSYGSLGITGSTASSNLFGTTRQNQVSLVSNGSSSAGMKIGTITADPLIFGTSDAARMTIGSTGIIDVTSSVTEPFRITGSNASSNSIYFQGTNTAAQTSIYVENNRGSFAAYGGQLVGGQTNAGANIFGVNRQDKYFIFSDGGSSLGMGIGTLTSDPFIIGTNNTNRLSVSGAGDLAMETTVTAGGTTGAQTINKMSGVVNFAAGATTLVVTNSLATTSSKIFVQVLGVDTTTKYATVTRASGSFTITLNAAAVAELPVCWFVVN